MLRFSWQRCMISVPKSSHLLPNSYRFIVGCRNLCQVPAINTSPLPQTKNNNLSNKSQKRNPKASNHVSVPSSENVSAPLIATAVTPETSPESGSTPSLKTLRNMLLDASKNRRPKAIAETYFIARRYGIELERSDYLTIFKAFLTPAPGNNYYLNSAAFQVYDKIKKEKLWTMDTFRYAVRLFEHNQMVNELLELDQIFDSLFSSNATHTEMMLNAFTACQSESNAWTHYNIYRANTVLNTLSTSNTNPPPNTETPVFNIQWGLPKPATFINLCGLLCQKNLNLRATSVLRDYCEGYSNELEGMTPSKAATSPDCLDRTIELLNTALSSYEITVIATVVSWITNEQAAIPQGVLQKIFEVCAAMGRPDILENAIQMQSQQGRILTPAEHAHMIVGYCRYGSIEKAVERLVLAEAAGVNFVKGTFYPPELTPTQQDIEKTTANFAMSYTPIYLQDSLSKLIRSVSDLDQLYYALVDLTSHGIRPPILALNAVLLSAGQVASLDRAFSMLQEYEPVFNVKPSLESYCALVDAVARANPPRISVMLAVLQEMDDSNFPPNSHCFSSLIEVMILASDVSGVQNILTHMEENQIQPTLRSLRRLAIFYAKKGDEENVKETCDRIVAMTQRTLPGFFLSRLNTIREKVKKTNAARGESSSGGEDK